MNLKVGQRVWIRSAAGVEEGRVVKVNAGLVKVETPLITHTFDMAVKNAYDLYDDELEALRAHIDDLDKLIKSGSVKLGYIKDKKHTAYNRYCLLKAQLDDLEK
jgi:hypothetical protein